MNDRAPHCIRGPFRPLREAMGAYILDALDPVEADRVAAHLTACANCRAEYAELADMVPLLARVTESEAINGPVRPEAAVLGRVLADCRRGAGHRADRSSRSRHRRIALAVAGVVLAVGGSGAGVRMASSHHAPPPNAWGASTVLPYKPDRSSPAITASVQVTATNWGSRIQLKMDHVQPGYVCSMVVVAMDGHLETGGTWSAPTGGSLTIFGSASVAPERIASIRVVLPDGTTLVVLTRPHEHLPRKWTTE